MHTHASLVETYNGKPPDACQFARGMAEEGEYDRGWKDWMGANLPARRSGRGAIRNRFQEAAFSKPKRRPAVGQILYALGDDGPDADAAAKRTVSAVSRGPQVMLSQ
jgi:hypothetical protein